MTRCSLDKVRRVNRQGELDLQKLPRECPPKPEEPRGTGMRILLTLTALTLLAACDVPFVPLI